METDAKTEVKTDWKSCFFDLSNQLTSDDEAKFRFILGGFLSVSELKGSSLSLFKRIHDKCENETVSLSRIREAMFHIRRYDVLRDILCSSFEEYQRQKYSDYIFDPIRVLMLNIYDELPDREIEDLALYFDATYRQRDPNASLNFFNTLLQENLVSRKDVSKLKITLSEMKRKDLATKVDCFMMDMKIKRSPSTSDKEISWPPPLSDKGGLTTERRKLRSYPMRNSDERGVCLIINNVTFKKSKKREGSDADVKRLISIFQWLKYDVMDFSDLTEEEMKQAFQMYGPDYDHGKYDIFLLFVLSHGRRDCVLSVDEKEVKISDIKEYFKPKKCPSLTEKPKLIFIQACQGDRRTNAIETDKGDGRLQQDGPDSSPGPSSLETDGSIPDESDFLTAIATVQDYVSHRDTEKGTWFIQTLCNVVEQEADTLNISDIMMHVNYQVSGLEGPERQKQASEYRATLRYHCFLTYEAYNQ